jgi:hypothetical protein
MKTFFKTFLPLLFFIMLTSCATTSAGGNHIEKKQNQEKLLFEDWKYKGFGQNLPVWFEAAYKDDLAKVLALLPDLMGKEVTIIKADGFNSDQSEQSLKLKLADFSADYVLYDSGWAMIEAGKYISLAILYKEF